MFLSIWKNYKQKLTSFENPIVTSTWWEGDNARHKFSLLKLVTWLEGAVYKLCGRRHGPLSWWFTGSRSLWKQLSPIVNFINRCKKRGGGAPRLLPPRDGRNYAPSGIFLDTETRLILQIRIDLLMAEFKYKIITADQIWY